MGVFISFSGYSPTLLIPPEQNLISSLQYVEGPDQFMDYVEISPDLLTFLAQTDV